MTLGSQDSTEPSDRSQISIRKSVVARHRSVPRTSLVERPEHSRGMNVANGSWIDQLRIETEWPSMAGVIQLHLADVEFQGRLIRVWRVDDDLCIREDEFIHVDTDLSVVTDISYLPALVLWRNVHREPPHKDGVYAHGLQEQASQACLKMELRDVNEWLDAWLPGIRIGCPEDSQAFALKMDPIGNPDVQFR